MPDAPLSLYEREEISRGLIGDSEVSWAELACRVGRHQTTVAREVSRNGGRDRYRPAIAEQRPSTPAVGAGFGRLEEPGPVRERMISELGLGRSPAAIWADLGAEGVTDAPCVATIYQAVYAGCLGKATARLRTRRPRRRPRRPRHVNRRPVLPNIAQRPQTVNHRTEPRHGEADHIPAHLRRSVTFDHGSEWAGWEIIDTLRIRTLVL